MNRKKITISLLTSVLIISFLFGSSNPFDPVVNSYSPIQKESIRLLAGMDSYINWTYSAGSLFDSATQQSNMALYFDGSDEVIISSDSSLNPTNAITVMAWINADDWDGNRRILQKGVDDQYRLIDEGNLEFGLAGVSGGDIGTPIPTTGVWHHVAGTYDGSTIRLYVDGVEEVSNSASGPLQTSSTSLYIGNKPLSSYSGDHFKGIIDEVRIYNRALSTQEINNTMSNELPETSGLVLYLSFDALEGSTCPDLSGHGNDGINYGAEIVTSFDWDDNNSPTTLLFDSSLPIPSFLHHKAGVSTSYFSIYWILPLGYNENDFEYEIEISDDREFNDASPVTTAQLMRTFTVARENWYYLRVRSVNDTHYGDWSDTTRIAVMVSTLILDGYVTSTITKNSGDQFVIWEIESLFYFNYSIEMGGEIQEVGHFREENITFSVLDFPVGTYYLTLTVVDVTGMEYQSEIVLHIEHNLSEVISTVGTTSLIGFMLLFGGIVIYMKYPRKKWREGVELEVESSDNIPLEYLANSNNVSMTTLTMYLATVDYAIISNDDTVYSTAFILSEIQSEQLREGRVQISKFIDEHNLDRDAFIALVLKRSEELVLTVNLVYNRSSIVEILKERLLETNSLDIELFFQETEVSSSAVESLLRDTGLRYYSDNDGVFKCIEYDGLKIINHALENGFVFVNQAIENSSVPLRDLKSFLSTRRDDVVFSSSLDLLVSAKWLSLLRDDVFEQGEVEIDVLATKHGTSPENMLSILQYFLHGESSSDKSKFRMKSHEVGKPSTSTTTRWTQPSLRSVYHSDPPPSGIQYQAPVTKEGTSTTAGFIQVCGCIWLPISLVLIFVTPFGSPAIAVTALLGFLWQYFRNNATKNPVRGQIIRKPGRLLPDGRYLCPYCHTRRMYAEEEMNDRGSVFCKECRAVFPLKETSEYVTTSDDVSYSEPDSTSHETVPPISERKDKTKQEYSSRVRGLMLLGTIGVGLLVASYVLQYSYYILRIDVNTIQVSRIVYSMVSSTNVLGSLFLASGLLSLREKYTSPFFVVAIMLLAILPLRFILGPILYSSVGIVYIWIIYLLHFLKLAFIGIGIYQQIRNSKYPSLWMGSAILMIAWGIAESFIPFILGGVYELSVINIFYIPGMIINLIGGFTLSLIFLSEIEILDPTPIVRYLEKITGFLIFICGVGLLGLGLLSWVVYIPVFSETWLGEILGLIVLSIGLVLIGGERRK